VKKGINDLGIKNLRGARAGQRVCFYGLQSTSPARQAAKKLLINLLIHAFEVHS